MVGYHAFGTDVLLWELSNWQLLKSKQLKLFHDNAIRNTGHYRLLELRVGKFTSDPSFPPITQFHSHRPLSICLRVAYFQPPMVTCVTFATLFHLTGNSKGDHCITTSLPFRCLAKSDWNSAAAQGHFSQLGSPDGGFASTDPGNKGYF